MSEPELIRNTAPHEITMPVGGRNAMGKSAHVGEPTIRRVLAEDNAYPTAPPSPAEKGGPTIRRVLAEDGAHLTAPPSPVEDRTVADTAPLPAENWTAADTAPLPVENRTVADTAPLPAENWTAADTAPLPVENWTAADTAPLPAENWTVADTAPLPAENWTAADTPPAQLKAATLAVHETANPVAPAKDQRTDTPVPQASEHAIAAAPNLKAQRSDELAKRLAALTAENDKVSHQLDGLEKLLGHQP